MSFELNAAFSLSIGIGAIAGCIRLRKIDTAFLPYLIWLWVGFINEISSIMLMKAGYGNIISYNLFSLFEAVVLTIQFKSWGLFRKKSVSYSVLQLFFAVSWCTETALRKNLSEVNSYFIICYSAIVVLLSINMLNKIMFEEPSALIRNPIFLICMGLIIYFTYAILVEAFWLYGLNKSTQFRISIYEILAYINLFTNIVFAIATIWIPLKRQYILRY
jgi:hypothetical protein